jgi:ribosomal protein S18 acetylase RimI-like enzyme
MDMNYELRDALPGDSTAVAKLEEQLFYENWMSDHTIRDELSRGPAWVVRLRGGLVGYLLTNYRAHVIDVIRLAVHPHRQGCGIGRILMETALGYPHQLATLTVRKENAAAVKLYTKLGFQLHGEIDSSWVLIRTSSPATRARKQRTCRSSSRRVA